MNSELSKCFSGAFARVMKAGNSPGPNKNSGSSEPSK